MTERSPTGTDEVVYSNVTKTECARGCGLGRGEYQPGDMLASSPGTSGIKRFSTEQKFLSGVWLKNRFIKKGSDGRSLGP
jgi:hypothetical protein